MKIFYSLRLNNGSILRSYRCLNFKLHLPIYNFKLFILTPRRYSSSVHPEWIDKLRSEAKISERNVSYDIKIFDELGWMKRKFDFNQRYWNPHSMSTSFKKKLCLGNELKEYMLIGEAMPFADREDNPVINNPSHCVKLYWDLNSPTEKILIQFSDAFPPILWMSVAPKFSALQFIFREFMECDTQHMKKYLSYYENLQSQIEQKHSEKLGEGSTVIKMKDAIFDEMRKTDPKTVDQDWQHIHCMYLGTQLHFRELENKYLMKNPCVFGWPLLLGESNHHMENSNTRLAVFRTIYSKSLLFFHTRLDLQVDPKQIKIYDNEEDTIVLDIPIFVTINFPENKRLCGGKALIERYNTIMGTSFPLTMPIDVIAALLLESQNKGISDISKEIEYLETAFQNIPEIHREIRFSSDIVSTNKLYGQLAYFILLLANMKDQAWESKYLPKYMNHSSNLIRVAIAKGASILHKPCIINKMLETESNERIKKMLHLLLDDIK